MENEEIVQFLDGQEQLVQEIEAEDLSLQVIRGGDGLEAYHMGKRAIGWAGVQGAIAGYEAAGTGKDVKKEIVQNAAIGAGVSVAIDGVGKAIRR